MFADRNRAGTYGIMLCLAAAMFGMFFFLTLFVQNVLGFSPLAAGSRLPAGERWSSPSARGWPQRLLPGSAPSPSWWRARSLAAGGLSWLTLTDVHSTYLGSVLGPMLVFGLGMGMEFVSCTLMALSGVAPQEAGAASGLLNATQQVGGSLGLSILVTVFGTASRTRRSSRSRSSWRRPARPSVCVSGAPVCSPRPGPTRSSPRASRRPSSWRPSSRCWPR